jgi:RNA polymerase sigma-70 factor (ECF subfamily)
MPDPDAIPTDAPPDSVDDLVRARLAERDFAGAFEHIVRQYQERVFRLAFSMVRDQTWAEDLAQETLVRVWKGLPGFTGQAAPGTWIYTIARNTCLTELKRRAARPTTSLNDPQLEDIAESLPALQTHDPEGGAELDAHALLDQLPDKYRRVLTLFYLEQRKYEEVATLLALPLGTVKTFIYRARKELIRLAGRQTSPPLITASTLLSHAVS